MDISQKQKDIIIGSLLGDGHLDTVGKITRLQLKQSAEKKEYIFWLYKELQNLCRSEPKQRKDNNQWYVNTRYRTELTSLRILFYRGRTKVVPVKIAELLKNPISLAVWFTDDGTLDWRRKDHYAFRLTTNCFSMEDNQKLIKVMKRNFGVEATVQTTLIRGKRYPRIHIGRTGRDRFYELVKPFMLNCFSHKLPPFNLPNPSETRSISIG